MASEKQVVWTFYGAFSYILTAPDHYMVSLYGNQSRHYQLVFHSRNAVIRVVKGVVLVL